MIIIESIEEMKTTSRSFKMDELIKLVVQKTGIPEATAKQVVELVVSQLKSKLPPPIAAQLDTVLSGGTAKMEDTAKGLGGMLGGLFGKK